MTATAPAFALEATSPTRYNVVRHGLLSRYAVLPWESRDEYEALLLERTLSALFRLRELRNIGGGKAV